MASLEEIYRATLIEIAEEGNEKAKLALSLGNQLGSSDDAKKAKTFIVNELQEANDELNDALEANADEWTRRTDRCIQNAQTSIMNALAKMANS